MDLAHVMAGLKGFQRDAVEHALDRLYGDAAGSGRFLVADETGLGKSIIARGVVARAIDHLHRDDSVGRIDVIYICSNLDLANQNLQRLNVTGDPDVRMASRLTLMARDAARLNAHSGEGKKVNLIAFTPATSMPEGGFAQGNAPERALLTLIIERIEQLDRRGRWALRTLLQGSVASRANFQRYVDDMVAGTGGTIDPSILAPFERDYRAAHRDRLLGLIDLLGDTDTMPPELKAGATALISGLRHSLAEASIGALEPDLVILDEFQRFRHLLDPRSGEAGELAGAMFSFPGARTLLLSATPYKPFTNSDEIDDDHYRDFFATIDFLFAHDVTGADRVRATLADYRGALLGGDDGLAAATAVREALLPVMSRSERPDSAVGTTPRLLDVPPPTADDLREYADLRRFGDAIGAPVSLEYWKSIPYFANFMDNYRPGVRAREWFGTPRGAEAEQILGRTRALTRERIEAREWLDLGNGYLRALADETVGRGWWRLLWMPPSMPYLKPGRVYREVGRASADLGGVTKRLVFSAWSGVPTAVASLLSYVADRSVARATSEREEYSSRLTYRQVDGGAGSLSTLALFWPHPELARLGDPLAAARRAGRAVSRPELLRHTQAALPNGPRTTRPWDAFFSVPGLVPEGVNPLDAVTAVTADDGDTASLGLRAHVERAAAASSADPLTHRDLALLAAFAPGVTALRAVERIAGGSSTAPGRWRAAFRLADALRRFFNREDSVGPILAAYPGKAPYWRSLLSYCADGNLQAVVDEYLFQLRSELGGREVDDAALELIVTRFDGAVSLRPARYVAHDTSAAREQIPLPARFALRYGGASAAEDSQQAARQSEVRAAFNSPFAPFVLATTSVGQEGIDFHWWCHSVVHWNLPSNPVDFEQREGRVNRFGGHAVRRNVAGRHWSDVLASTAPDPWAAAFEAASAASSAASSGGDWGEFAPWWCYPSQPGTGEARVERVIARYPLSRDQAKYQQLTNSLALYRLALGQPRQEDMLELLQLRGVSGTDVATIDLRPPRHDGPGPVS
ncbi:helicase-related protein [Tessaracoccus defluvii]|uniref:helicase-related protein n=2 Tax=Tessaracoccus defluvii TaxID=1285901 RepID=UPI0031DC08B7